MGYQEPIIANMMNLPAVACQDRAHAFFNCRVLQPRQSMSLESTLPYYMYAVLGTQTPSNWENLRDVLGPVSKLMGPVAVISAAWTGGFSAAAYLAVHNYVADKVTHTVTGKVQEMLNESGIMDVFTAEEITEKLEENSPEMLSAWSTYLGPAPKYLKIVGGLGGDVEQETPHATAMHIEEVSKEEFVQLKLTAILPAR